MPTIKEHRSATKSCKSSKHKIRSKNHTHSKYTNIGNIKLPAYVHEG